ncbi:MAG: thioredoxin [bacterium]|nr:thioredoxin [bacterium]
MDIIKIKEEEFEEKVLKNNKKVLVDFYADWCGPCRMLSPIIEEIAKENDEYEFVKVNVDDCPEVSRKYGVMSIPTLIVFENGVEKKKTLGFHSLDEVKEFLKD